MTELRPLDAFGAAVAAAIHARADATPWSAETIAGLLAQPGVRGLLALAADAPVGFVLFRVAADEAEILTLAVLPEARRRGHARRLMAEAVATVRAHGARRLLLEVATTNRAATDLYRALGFSSVGSRRGYYATGAGERVDATIMALDLA